MTEGNPGMTSPIRLTVRGVSGTASADGGCDAVCRICGARWRTRDMRTFTTIALAHRCGDGVDPTVALCVELVALVGIGSLPAGLVERLKAAGVVKE